VAGSGTTGGYSADQFVAYFLVMMVVDHLTFIWHMWEFEYRIRTGAFSPLLLRPIHPTHNDICENVSYKMIGLVGIPRQDWLFDERLVLPALIVTAIWLRIPLNIIFYLAALQGVDRTLYEAARIDGAGRWNQFRYITWPLVTPTTFFVVIITTISLLIGGFDMISVMTQGGPLDASNVLVFNIWRTAFVYFQMGYASAMAYVLFLVVLIFTLIQWWLQKRWVHY